MCYWRWFGCPSHHGWPWRPSGYHPLPGACISPFHSARRCGWQPWTPLGYPAPPPGLRETEGLRSCSVRSPHQPGSLRNHSGCETWNVTPWVCYLDHPCFSVVIISSIPNLKSARVLLWGLGRKQKFRGLPHSVISFRWENSEELTGRAKVAVLSADWFLRDVAKKK